MKFVIFIFASLVLVLLVAAESGSSCEDCIAIDKAWNEIRDYLQVRIEDGGRFYNPSTGWARDSIYLVTAAVPSSGEPVTSNAPLCAAVGGRCVRVSKAGCATEPETPAAAPLENQDCAGVGERCCVSTAALY